METGLQVPSDMGSLFSLSVSGALSELGKAPFVASWMVMSNSGTVKSYLFFSILSNTLEENWAPNFRMYRRNVSLRHLPMIIMVSSGTPAR